MYSAPTLSPFLPPSLPLYVNKKSKYRQTDRSLELWVRVGQHTPQITLSAPSVKTQGQKICKTSSLLKRIMFGKGIIILIIHKSYSAKHNKEFKLQCCIYIPSVKLFITALPSCYMTKNQADSVNIYSNNLANTNDHILKHITFSFVN